MPYITCMISGVPKPFSAMWRTIGTTRSARGLLLHSAIVDDGQVGLDEPHCSSFDAALLRGAGRTAWHREKTTPSNHRWGRICEVDKDPHMVDVLVVRRQGFEPRTR